MFGGFRPHLLFFSRLGGTRVELTHDLCHDWPQLWQHKDSSVEDVGFISNVQWTMVLRELVCDAMEGFDDVTQFRWRALCSQ